MATLTCEEARALLPELAEGSPRLAGPVEVHLASCAACATELSRYRGIVLELAAFQGAVLEPPEGFLGRVLSDLPEPSAGDRLRLVRRITWDPRLQQAALSLGGVVVGATAIGLLWWRAARRTVGASAAQAPHVTV
jgi:hypothetical protein